MRGKKDLLSYTALAITLSLAFPAMVFAGSLPYPPAQDRPKGPPPEAFAACDGKKEGDVVTVVLRRGEKVEAVCEPLDSRLVARPKGAPPPPNGQ